MTAPKSLTIPAAALTQHTAIVGKTGSGKTSTAKLMIEQVVAEGSRVCVLDPVKSDWWGVISSADGKRPGLPFHVLGGPHAHVALHSGAGAAIGELVARGELPLSVLDMAEFEPGGQQRFFVAFADTLLKRMRGVLYLVLEEAHEFAPKERAGFEKENLAIHFAKKLATAGRSKGIRLILATQRTQSLHNALLGSCDTLIAHRLTAPADQEPVKKWLKANADKDVLKQIEGELSSLKTGTAWLCSGEAKVFERIQFPRISTFDNSATPTDDAEELEIRGGNVDVDSLRALIGDAVVEAEANDPKKLKARIRELEQSREALDTAGMIALERAEDLVRQAEARVREELEGLAERRAAAAVAELRNSARPHAEALYHALANGSGAAFPTSNEAPKHAQVGHPPTRVAPASPPRAAPVARPATPSRPRSAAAAPKQSTTGGLTGPQQRVLDAIAWYGALGIDAPGKVEVGLIAGYRVSKKLGGTYSNILGALRSGGLIEYRGAAQVTLTVSGAAAANDPEIEPTNESCQAAIIARLDSVEERVLRIILDAHPESLDKVDVGTEAGYSVTEKLGGTFSNILGRLRTLGLIDYPERGRVVATDLLFPEALTR